ncbi:hotdog domain-containing protein [Rhodococcus sp. IEGM 1307]|jgi:predicted thioesterase|uniref:thioesterase family protein n=1 Tax=Rhodococcus sp. IEGM 1307 TaxID=3047091 RepID=UPI0024B792AF|nr:hotdog domain-containing protein [Rhodococcus sp. IEGM 1307]MDI9978852.1 hotdog domain-containing protein [Rhodococcus sp. IEGM 1307]
MSTPDSQDAVITASKLRTVVESDCVARGGYHVLSTPNVIQLIEETAVDALHQVVETGQSSVGSRLEIVHSKPTLLDQEITATVSVREIDRRRYVFDVEVRDDVELIAQGTHERFVIDEDVFGRKLLAKQHVTATR